jgi:ferredoxin
MASTAPTTTKKPYVPKWKKKATLAEQLGAAGAPLDPSAVGLKGNTAVLFRQGNETKTTMAFSGQLIRDVASQAGQFIQYGCGKGECGTCECLVNGQWIRPCVATVPPMAPGETYLVQLKAQKSSKSVSSGTFFSVRSFLMGFWNNFLGVVGLFKFRGAAKKNWDERQEFERLVRERALEKKRQRLLQ